MSDNIRSSFALTEDSNCSFVTADTSIDPTEDTALTTTEDTISNATEEDTTSVTTTTSVATKVDTTVPNTRKKSIFKLAIFTNDMPCHTPLIIPFDETIDGTPIDTLNYEGLAKEMRFPLLGFLQKMDEVLEGMDPENAEYDWFFHGLEVVTNEDEGSCRAVAVLRGDLKGVDHWA